MSKHTKSTDTQRSPWHVYHKINLLRELISQGNYPGGDFLAEKLEVSRRSIMRYLDILRENDAPLEYDRRRKGYYFLNSFWQLPPLKLSEGDMLAFFIAEQSLKMTGNSEYAHKLRTSLGKLAALLPNQVSINLTSLSTGVSFQSLPFASVKPDTLDLLSYAAINQQVIEFDYYSPHNQVHSKRQVHVLLLHNFAGDWFAVSFDPVKGDYRDFHAGRMKNVRLLNQYFVPPEKWDSNGYLKQGFFMMRGGRLTTVRILFDSYQAQWIRERDFFHPDEQREELPDGSLRLSFQTGEDGLQAVARFCLTYAGNCRVEKPDKLKELVREKLQKGLDLHQ